MPLSIRSLYERSIHGYEGTGTLLHEKSFIHVDLTGGLSPCDAVGSTWMTMSGNHEDVPPHLFAAASDGEASSNINPAAMW